MSRPRTAAGLDVYEELRQALVALLGAARRLRSRDKVTADGLTFVQAQTLTRLRDSPVVTAGDLARFVDLNPASMTAMLDHLESADVIQRERSIQDRRVVNVSLTDKGRTLARRRRDTWETRWRAALADLTDEELLAAVRVMHRVAGLLDEEAQDR